MPQIAFSSGMARWLLLLLSLWAPAALALESAPVTSPRASVTLAADAATLAPGRTFRVALRQSLAPGWHTYWLNPGDAGQPPEMTLDLPPGWLAGPLLFPAPTRIPYGPLVNFGYEGEALFLMEVTPPITLRPGDTATLTARADWLVCERVCIPEEGAFSLTFPVEATIRPANTALFQTAEAALPRPGPFAPRLGFSGGRGALALEGQALSPASVRDAFFFPLEQSVLENAAPQPMSVRDGILTLGLTRAAGRMPAELRGVVAITDAAGVRGAYLVQVVPGAMPELGGGLPLWQALAFALLGGLILNAMPCVFPILAMKAMALARLSGAPRAEIRAHAASYTAGVVLSFLLIAAVMLGLRAAGAAAGWGFQFTSPVFVALMAWLLLAVGLNLSGVFAVSGPVSAGGGLAAKGGHAGSFFTGVLAVLVATPCTAPFMAAAIGAAFAMPPAATLAVFGAMGVGLALPYAALGLAPGLAQRLPRPGAWMDRLKQALAFPMYAAAAWLVWVLAQQAGADGVLLVLAGAVLVSFAAWALGLAQEGRGRRAFQGTALMALLAAAALLPQLRGASAPLTIASGEAWSAERLATLRSDGRPVFVNLTAAWCISCKVNERVALDTTAVRAAMERAGMVILTGDWTNGDAAITALLRSHGRDGVPLYLVFPTGGGAPALLPQILTEGMMLQAISEAARGT